VKLTNNGSSTFWDGSEASLSDPQDIREWMASVSGEKWLWYLKLLSANDTLATGSHQNGTYLPKSVLRLAFPKLAERMVAESTPRTSLCVRLDTFSLEYHLNVIWYSSKNEARITGWGGKTSPMLDPEATGALCIFAFRMEPGRNCQECRVWLCRDQVETDEVTAMTGDVEPGEGLLVSSGVAVPPRSVERDYPCLLAVDDIPEEWKQDFPPATEIVAMAVSNLPSTHPQRLDADRLLMRRRECEFQIFRAVEEYHVLPRLEERFATVNLFVAFANAVTNRRKSRSGKSLELHAHYIFNDANVPHVRERTTEGKKRPDFLFPSDAAYHDSRFPSEKLRMLAAKTSCKDRWRQVINEARRIPTKHLLTLQQGISQNQFEEMRREHIQLVVPSPIQQYYPKAVREHLMSLSDFIAEVQGTML
jgi:hypothetical protein